MRLRRPARNNIVTTRAGGVPNPIAGYGVNPELQVRAFAPGATPNVQGGAYVNPYGAPTQIPSIYPDRQLFCGVEAIERRWQVLTAADVPYFQQTPRQMPVVTTRDGGRPGALFGPGAMSQTYGGIRQSRAMQAQQFAAGLVGW